jgi:hypothetical protein
MLRMTTEENVGFVLSLGGSLSDQGSVCPLFIWSVNEVSDAIS